MHVAVDGRGRDTLRWTRATAELSPARAFGQIAKL